MRTVFFGTPEIAVPALEALCGISEVVGVVCQPDRPAGRGLQHRAPPVKAWASDHGLSVVQPEKVRDGALRQWLSERQPDVAIVLAYGRILPPDVLTTPRQGCLNLHASLLPRHRGAAPIQWALMAGDSETGISLMQMDEGLDTGPVFSRHTIGIGATDDNGSLTNRLGQLAATVIVSDLPLVMSGQLTAVPQDSEVATWAPPLKHEDQLLNFAEPAIKLAGTIQGLSPKPGAYTTHRARRLKVLQAQPCDEPVVGPPGTVKLSKHQIWVATGSGTLSLLRLQLEGKAVQNASDLVNGRAIAEGERLGSPAPASH